MNDQLLKFENNCEYLLSSKNKRFADSELSFIISTPKIGFSTLIPGLDQKETYAYMLKFYDNLIRY